MKTFLFPLLLLTQLAMAQNLTLKEARRLADQLQEVQLLSQAGREALMNQVVINQQAGLAPHRRVLLSFCAMAFVQAAPYRMGLVGPGAADHQALAERKAIIEADPSLDLDAKQAALRRVDAEAKEQTQQAEGFLLEQGLEPEPEYTAPQGWSIFPPLNSWINRRVWQYQWLHPQRSAMGKHRHRTLRDLQSLGLITPQEQSEAERALAEDPKLSSEAELLRWLLERN